MRVEDVIDPVLLSLDARREFLEKQPGRETGSRKQPSEAQVLQESAQGRHGRRTEPGVRAMVLALHWFGKQKWTEIAVALTMRTETARLIVQRAKENAKNAEDFWCVYDALVAENEKENNAEATGAKIHKGSAESEAMREIALRDSDHRDQTFPENAHELGISTARSTLERVMHKHHQIFRYCARVKPDITDVMQERLDTAHLGLKILVERIVFIDESWMVFNQNRKKKNQSRMVGEDPHSVARKQDKHEGEIRLMFAAGICVGSRSPCYIYEKTPKHAKAGVKRHQDEVTREVNRDIIERAVKRRVLAQVPGTEENRRVIQVNQEVDQRNHDEGRGGRTKLRHKNAAQVFKADTVKPPQQVHGVNWVNYKEKFLDDIIYPWITSVVKPRLKERTGSDEVWLVEDNAAAHKTLKNIDAQKREELGIKVFAWPPRLPDMNKIEPCWGYTKTI